MKKILLAAMLLVSMAITAQVEYLPFENVKHIAIENAKSLWGDVYADEPIPLYSINGDLIAYTFNFSIGQPFPSRQTLIERCNSPAGSEEKTDRWLIGQFANMLVSAGSNMTPILKYSGAISDDYAYGARIEELAFEKLQSENCSLEKIIFMSDMAKWFVYSDRDGNRAYVKVFPPIEVYNELEFNEAVQQRYTKAGLWVIPEDNENLWTSFLNGKLLNGKSNTLIPDEDFVPYYDWSYGCTPTAFSMALAYWDNRGMPSANDYGNLVKHHFQRYDHVQGDTDKNVPDLQKALAIAMSTDSMTGSTGSCCWLSGFVNETDARGYSFTGTDKYGTSAQYLDWAQTEIDAGRPYHMGTPGHSNTGVGYTSDNYLIRHDTWQPSHSSVYYTSCDLVGTIVPGGQYGAAVNITSPFGDPRYTDNVVPPSQGEHLYAGDRFEITWNYDYYSGSYARLLYSTNGGYNWTVISSNTPNDGLFDWSIPSGLANSSLGRVKVEVRDGGTSAVQAADGSYGNFDFHSGGSLPSLSEDASTVTTTVPDYYQFANTSLYWSVVGLRATNGSDDWDIELHSGTAFNDVIASSSYGGTTVDFVVIDGNHTPSTDRGIKARRYSGTSTARVEYEGGSDVISAGVALNTSWPANDVVEIYDINLNPGTYGFILDVTSGTANLDFALFGSDGAAYYAPRGSNKAMSSSGGAGGDEYFTYTVISTDWYGLCLWSNDANTANYTLRIESPGTWTGLVSTNWNNANNWSGHIIPDAGIDVTIPSGTPFQPYIYTAIANCKNITINTGATLTVGGYALNVAGNLTVNGTLASNNASGEINVQGDVVWNSGSTANFTTTAPFRVYGHWNFESGSNANLANGTVLFMGDANKYISSYSSTSSFNHVGSYKTGGYHIGVSYYSTQPLTINGYIYVHPGAIFGIYSTNDVILKGDVNSNGTFLCNYGTVVLDGSNQSLKMNTGDYFNYLTFSQAGTVTISNSLSNILDVNGNLVIESGIFNLQDRTMHVGGNWTNTVGTTGFVEGTSRVIFNGSGHQYVYSNETFNILEANMGAALRIINAAYTVTCNQYDWTTGGIDVVAGTFTALDLADNGIYGGYWLNPGGTINLTNTDGYVDLNGNLNIFEGNFNVFGGTTYSYWPFAANASINMSGGVLDFKDQGIYIYNSGIYTLTENITGGIISTSRGFNSNRADFSPSAGLFEFYGTGDYNISQVAGSTLPNVKINKGAAKEGDPEITGPVFDERSGMQLSDGGKANTIALSSNFTITGNLNIAAGTFDLSAYTCNVSGTTDIYGTLTMTNAANDLTAGTINWQSGSNDNVTAGTFNTNNWRFNEGTNAKLGLGNTAYIYNLYYPTDNDAEFGNLIAVPASKVLEGGESGKAYYPVRVAGNFDMQGTTWTFAEGATDLIVSGNSNIPGGNSIYFSNGADFSTNGSLNFAGNLSLSGGSVATLHGSLTFPSTGYLYLDASSFICDQNSASGSITLNGRIDMNAGSVFEMTGRNVIIGTTFNDDNIGGGDLRFGRSLTASITNNFQLNWGNLEMMSSNAGHYLNVTNGNYLNHLLITKPSADVYIANDLTLKGYFTLNSGVFNTNIKNMYVGGNWTNVPGPASFLEHTGTVYFNGSGDFNHQRIYGETFYNLTNAKTGNGQLMIEGPVTVINNFLANVSNMVSANLNVNGLLDLSAGIIVLTTAAPTVIVNNFTMGGNLGLSNGSFSCNDITNNGIFGTIDLYNGSIILNQSDLQYTDLNGSLNIHGGTMTVNGNYGYSEWGWAAPASFTMSDGILNFNNPGISINASKPISASVSGGTIKTRGVFLVTHPTFIPSGGTAELYGNNPAGIQSTGGSHFYNLKIDKQVGLLLGADYTQNDVVQMRMSEPGRLKVEIPLDRSDNYAITIGNLKVNNNTVIDEGNLRIVHEATIAGNVTVNSGGNLSMEGVGSMAMGSGKALTVNNGGELSLQGTVTDYPKITRISGNYGLNIESGATIGAEYAIFEYMNTNGVNVKSGAIVDPAKSFTNCNFRNGQSGGRLLTINNSQSLLLSNVVFPGSSGNYNVSKTVDAGVVVLSDYSGVFAGPTNEQDTYGRIHWTGEISSTITLDGVLIGSGQDLCFEALQTITLGGSQSFILESGGNVNLVAGQNIRLLEGTHVQSGAYLHAWITTDGIYCGSGSSMLAAVEENSLTGSDVEKPNGQSGFRIYPNPTRGIFTLEMDDLMEFSSINVDICNVVGEKILSFELPEFKQYKFDLTNQQPGIYLIRVMRGKEVGVDKVIRR
ncbi:MAG: hypothetical protein IH597_12600 [Bacteroidales bacterium]|nr:hypothetical protein [Bacteroidales bacterium]